jgi:tRNA threonylcarbamoyladenosine biosynthesis protein TsaE
MAPCINVVVDLPDEAATRRLGQRLARLARRGDVFALAGEVGCGKTTLARAFIRALAGADEDVPSPTFTLAQSYDYEGGTIWHFDLYRLEKAEDALELGIEEAFAEGISLIEWPERLGPWLPADRLTVALAAGAGPTSRRAALCGGKEWERRLGEGFDG